jgi:hypothetical protein
VLIYGQLTGSAVSGQRIRLYHHIDGGRRGFQYVTSVRTNASGLYAIVRADGVVQTDREWFVVGPHGVSSRIVFERVTALVSVNASTGSATTGQPVFFTGNVSPTHRFERVLLQEQNSSGDDWRTLSSGLLGPGSSYTVKYSWATPGEHDVRIVLPGDLRNIRSESDAVPVTIQQRQVSGFTINTSTPITPYAQSVTISGGITPAPNAQPATVQLWARPAQGGVFTMIDTTPVGPAGTYSFSEQPLVNTVYEARTTFGAVQASALLWQGVRGSISLSASSTTAAVGQPIAFTGGVIPNKAGELAFLQRLGQDGEWHDVEARFVRSDSTFQFGWTFGQPGTSEFRARIYSDGRNVGAASTPPVTITVSGLSQPHAS